jgi:transcriptional regulator with XRE-family HTH domain
MSQFMVFLSRILMSVGDIEKRTGLLRFYISRVENGHSIPAIETLEKFARAMDMQLYPLLDDGSEPPELPNLVSTRLLTMSGELG